MTICTPPRPWTYPSACGAGGHDRRTEMGRQHLVGGVRSGSVLRATLTALFRQSGTTNCGTPPKNSKARLWLITQSSSCWERVASAKV